MCYFNTAGWVIFNVLKFVWRQKVICNSIYPRPPTRILCTDRYFHWLTFSSCCFLITTRHIVIVFFTFTLFANLTNFTSALAGDRRVTTHTNTGRVGQCPFYSREGEYERESGKRETLQQEVYRHAFGGNYWRHLHVFSLILLILLHTRSERLGI